MAAPVAGTIRLPDDSGNTGKKVRTQTRVIGADTVHEHFMVPLRSAQVLGVYCSSSAVQSVQAAAQNGTTTGFLWAHVPTAVTGKKARLRNIEMNFQFTGITAMPSVPRIALARFTFTGTASGAQQAAAKLDSGASNPILDLRTASTGLAVALGAIMAAELCPTSHTAGTAASFTVSPASQLFLWLPQNDMDDEFPVFGPGEGFVVYQPDAGTTTDLRRFVKSLTWDEIDTA